MSTIFTMSSFCGDLWQVSHVDLAEGFRLKRDDCITTARKMVLEKEPAAIVSLYEKQALLCDIAADLMDKFDGDHLDLCPELE